MQFLQVILLANFFTLLVAHECDMRWIRQVFIMACGMRKRSSDGSTHEPAAFISETEAIWPGLLIQRKANFSTAVTGKPGRKLTLEEMSTADITPGGSNGYYNDLSDADFERLHRREISGLVDKCCKVTMTTTCSAKDFIGACK